MTTETIHVAAGAIAESRVAVERAEGALAAAEAAGDQVRNRLDEKKAERAEIVGARKAGVETPKDGARLMTIAADAENLEAMLAEAEAVASNATRGVTEAKRVLAQAEGDLAKARDTELLRRLVENATALDRLLLRNVTEIADTWKRLGRSPGRECWVPTPALAEAIKRLDLTRDNRR